MKLLIVIACAVLASCAPLDNNLQCEDLLTEEQCLEFDAIDLEFLGEEHDEEDLRERRQAPPDPFLVKLVQKKLEFLMNLGLLRRVPFLGQKIEDLIRNDPEGVANALAGGIGGLINLVKKIIFGQ